MSESRSPWIYVLSGCAVLVVVVGVVLAVLAVYVWRQAKEFEAAMKDPAVREARALEVLGAESLPEGWRPAFAMSVPLIGEMALLTEGEPVASSEGIDIGDTGFVYAQMIGGKADEARARFEATGDLGDVFRDANVRVSRERELARGSTPIDGGLLLWVASLGDADIHGARVGGMTTMGLVDCEHDRRSRFVIWFGPAPEGDPSDPSALAGTSADPATLEAFLAHFRLCAK